MLRRYTTQAGRTRMVQYRASARVNTEKGKKRKEKTNPTTEAVRKVNFRIAVWNLCAIMNNNYQGGDYHLVLTHGTEPTKEEAKKKLKSFLGKMKRRYEKAGKTFKWIAATEYEQKRIHHHVIVPKMDTDTIRECWPHGWVTPKPMDDSGNYIKLAEYLVKETEKTFRQKDSPHKKRYSRSRNLELPKVDHEEVTERTLRNGPKEEKGYYIDQDTVRTYEHAILGVECMEYIMISLEEVPRKRRKRGKWVKPEKEYKTPEERQLMLNELICDEEGKGKR